MNHRMTFLRPLSWGRTVALLCAGLTFPAAGVQAATPPLQIAQAHIAQAQIAQAQIAQAQAPAPADAVQAIKEAMQLLDSIRGSNLDPWWRSMALARAARTQARFSDVETVRTLAQDAALVLREDRRTQPPPGLSDGAILAILTQAYADIRDVPGATGLVNAAFNALTAIGDPATQANTFAYLALALIDLNAADAARQSLLSALQAAAKTSAGRERVSALALIAIAQMRMQDRDAAAASLEAARDAVKSVAAGPDRSVSLAHLARAEIALGNAAIGRQLARDAANLYDRTTSDLSVPPQLRVATLSLIALAQTEAGDRTAGRQTARVLRQLQASITAPYDRFTALLTYADTLIQVEAR